MQRLNDAINLRLAHTSRVLVVLLQENHLDTALVRKQMNDDPILPYLRIAVLKALVALVLKVEYPSFRRFGQHDALDEQ